MPSSVKHHYIPRFYLAGFTDENNTFFIYDKKTEKIWKSTPENSFFENHRNTGEMQNQKTKEIFKSDEPEKALSMLDGRVAPVIAALNKSNPEENALTPERLYLLRRFIFSIFWRSPVNDKVRNEIIAKATFKELGFGFFDREGNRVEEVEEISKKIDLFQKMYPILLSISPFIERNLKQNDSDWRIYYRTEKSHLITDNPIIYDGYKNFNSLHEELLLPLSSKILLVSTKKYKPHILSPLFSLNVDLLLLHNAGRFVASANKGYLEFLTNEERTKLNRPGWADKLHEWIFNCFY